MYTVIRAVILVILRRLKKIYRKTSGRISKKKSQIFFMKTLIFYSCSDHLCFLSSYMISFSCPCSASLWFLFSRFLSLKNLFWRHSVVIRPARRIHQHFIPKIERLFQETIKNSQEILNQTALRISSAFHLEITLAVVPNFSREIQIK